MLTKTLLPLAAVLGFSTAVFAQNVTGASSHNPTGAITDRQQIIEAQQRQHQAKIRRAWLASGHKLEFPGAAPSIIHGSVPVKNFDVANQPAAPTIKVRFKTGASGVHEINVYFYSESTDQF